MLTNISVDQHTPVHVFVCAGDIDTARFMRQADELQSAYHFYDTAYRGGALIKTGNDPGNSLFTVDASEGIEISMWQVDAMCSYLKTSVESYFLVCTFMALTQWRSLVLNPLMKEEDFYHRQPFSCVFSRQGCKKAYCQVLEAPMVCEGCKRFYADLGAARELETFIRSFRFLRRK